MKKYSPVRSKSYNENRTNGTVPFQLLDRCRSNTIIESGGGMGGIYRTFMVDPLGALPAGLGNAIQSQLAVLFSPIVGYNNFFENNWVFFDPVAAAPMAHELLVYFMPPGKSVVKNAPSNGTPIDLSAEGNTAFGAGASEVYVKYTDAVLLAKLAFHELMHNRLKQGNSPLHNQQGLAGASISSTTQLNDRNIKSMAAVLRDPITQWTAGISILNNGKHDPLSEYYQV
jgi:hypothetical protein